MERFILRFQGDVGAPPSDVALIRHRCRVVDESRRMLLVEAPGQEAVDQLLSELPGWKSSREVEYRAPEPPIAITRPSKGRSRRA